MASKDGLNVALVTGGAGGIGLAIAKKLYASGMRVCVWDRKSISANEIGAEADRIMVQQVDITNSEAINEALKQIRDQWGGISVLINNAGISPKNNENKGIGILDVTAQEWSTVMDVNLTSLLRLIQATAPDMIRQNWGRIINMASQAGRSRTTVPGVAYVCTKTAVIGLSRYAADELGPHGITVNTLAPGRIASEMTAVVGDQINAVFVERTPVRRMGSPEDVAAAVAFYVTDEAAFLSGTILDVNGGLYMP